jgi:hypothetical protein
MYDGATSTQGNTDSNMTGNNYINMYSKWSGSTKQTGSSGSSGTSGSYDGGISATDIHILNRDASTLFLQGTISDIRIYNSDLGQTVAEDLTSYD